MECVEAFIGDFAVDDLLDFSNADAFVREESSSSQREEDEQEQEQEREKAKCFSDQNTSRLPLEDLLSFPSSKLDVPVSSTCALCFSLPFFFSLFLSLLCFNFLIFFVLFCLLRLVIWRT